MELLKDYDCTILYHLGKVNVVADALSRKSMGSLARISMVRRSLIYDLHELRASGVRLEITETGSFLAHFRVKSSLVERVEETQKDDPELSELMDKVRFGKARGFLVDEGNVLWLESRLCVPNVGSLRRVILEEAHGSAYVVHPGATKLYQDLKQVYWWEGMKRDVVDFVSRCLTCQQVKVEHQKPTGPLQQIKIPE